MDPLMYIPGTKPPGREKVNYTENDKEHNTNAGLTD